jgi:hypothetical protein
MDTAMDTAVIQATEAMDTATAKTTKRPGKAGTRKNPDQVYSSN